MHQKHLPEQGWELEATGPVESKTPKAAFPAPGQKWGHNLQETVPVRRVEQKCEAFTCIK